jgi:hypothetical protein
MILSLGGMDCFCLGWLCIWYVFYLQPPPGTLDYSAGFLGIVWCDRFTLALETL